MLNGKFCIILTLMFVFLVAKSEAQDALKPRPSPLDMVTLNHEGNYIKITYGRPHKRGRKIFGDLVPFGQVWRTGANEATEITLNKDMKIDGKRMKAGTYTIFSIPGPDEWTIIFNSDLGQWGAYNYNPDKDVLRFTVPVQHTDVVYEPFTINLELKDNKADLIMIWDQTKVAFPIEFLY